MTFYVLSEVEAANEEAAQTEQGQVVEVWPKPDDIWKSDHDYPMGDWRDEVSNGDTILGYWAWVQHCKESAAAEG